VQRFGVKVNTGENIMNIKTITEKIKAMDNKIIYAVSIAAAIAVVGIAYMTFGKDDSYERAKTEEPVPVSTIT
jgi:hypothetical protein